MAGVATVHLAAFGSEVGPSICAMEPWMMPSLEAEGIPQIQPWMALGCERPNVQQQRAIERIKEQHGGELPSDLYNQMLSLSLGCFFG